MKDYTVVIHYEGSYTIDVKAKTEEEAWNKADAAFNKASPTKLIRELSDVFICDCYEK